jgi:hypothetical protein
MISINPLQQIGGALRFFEVQPSFGEIEACPRNEKSR